VAIQQVDLDRVRDESRALEAERRALRSVGAALQAARLTIERQPRMAERDARIVTLRDLHDAHRTLHGAPPDQVLTCSIQRAVKKVPCLLLSAWCCCSVHAAARAASLSACPAVEPAAVDLAELGVAVTVRMLLEIFQMEQLEGDAGLAPLGVQVGAVRDGAMVRRRCRGARTHGPTAPRR
jgi:hypothetical protein